MLSNPSYQSKDWQPNKIEGEKHFLLLSLASLGSKRSLAIALSSPRVWQVGWESERKERSESKRLAETICLPFIAIEPLQPSCFYNTIYCCTIFFERTRHCSCFYRLFFIKDASQLAGPPCKCSLKDLRILGWSNNLANERGKFHNRPFAW